VLEHSDPSAESTDSQSTVLQEVIAEFGRHLDMLAEQLGASLIEADRECVSVGESFHELSAAKGTIEGIVCDEPARTVLRSSCKQIGDSLHTAVVALQYHDRLAQRLTLVRAGLIRLQDLLQDHSPRSYGEWLHALREVEQTNRTEQKRLGPAVGQTNGSGPCALSQSSVELF
jgi:hypothetical protein